MLERLPHSDQEFSVDDSSPLLLLVVFCIRLPCSPRSRMLCFSSSRWPLCGVDGNARRAAGALVAPVVVGNGVDGFCLRFCHWVLRQLRRRNVACRATVPGNAARVTPANCCPASNDRPWLWIPARALRAPERRLRMFAAYSFS